MKIFCFSGSQTGKIGVPIPVLEPILTHMLNG